MAFHQAIEFIALLHFDAKIDQKSRFENDLYKTVIDQLKNNSHISPRTLALCWLYCQAHATNPLGQFIKPILADDNLWVFDQTDLKDAITLLLLNDLNEKIKHDLELKKLISMQFETDSDMKTWAMNFYDTEAKNLPKRVSKQPIFISVDSQVSNFYMLSGKYNFDAIRNNTVAFVREGGKIEKFSPHPYYLAYYPGKWIFQNSARYESNESVFWISFDTRETDYLSLGANWDVAKQGGESGSATVKIFANEDEFKKFNESKRTKG